MSDGGWSGGWVVAAAVGSEVRETGRTAVVAQAHMHDAGLAVARWSDWFERRGGVAARCVEAVAVGHLKERVVAEGLGGRAADEGRVVAGWWREAGSPMMYQDFFGWHVVFRVLPGSCFA